MTRRVLSPRRASRAMGAWIKGEAAFPGFNQGKAASQSASKLPLRLTVRTLALTGREVRVRIPAGLPRTKLVGPPGLQP